MFQIGSYFYKFSPVLCGCSFCFQFARLFAMLPRPGDNEVTFAVFESSLYLLIPVYLLKDRGKLSALPKNNKRTCLPIFTLSLFNAERQAGKL